MPLCLKLLARVCTKNVYRNVLHLLEAPPIEIIVMAAGEIAILSVSKRPASEIIAIVGRIAAKIDGKRRDALTG